MTRCDRHCAYYTAREPMHPAIAWLIFLGITAIVLIGLVVT